MNVYQRISAVMKEVKYIQKNGYNAFHKYKYASEADYIESLRPSLLKHGLIILPMSQKVSVQGELTTVEMEFKIVNVDDPTDFVVVPGVGQGMDKGDKGSYKATTGAKKYMLSLTFLVETGDDPEGDISVDKRAADKTAPKAETAPAKATEPVAAASTPATIPATEAKKTGGFKPGKPISNGTASAPAKTVVNSAGDSW